MIDWFQSHEQWMWWLVVISAFTFVVSLLAVPWLLVRIPPRYFMSTKHAHPWGDQHPIVHVVLLVMKNLLGVIFIVLGVLMLVLPGQGVLTILAGLVLLDFPGKHNVLLWTVSRPPVLASINWLRSRAKREPLVVPETV
jgi:hypothetical protein